MSYTSPTELIEAFAPCVSSEIEDEQIDLVRAALLIARTEYPALDIEAYAARVDQLAYRAAERAWVIATHTSASRCLSAWKEPTGRAN